MTSEEIENQKHVEFYASTVNAWFNTKLEHDKSLLTLSVGAIGFLVTILTSVGSSIELLTLYLSAIFSFIICLIAVLVIFKLNSTYLTELLNRTTSKSGQLLQNLDSIALITFGVGVLLTAIIGGVTAINTYKDKGESMSNETKKAANQIQTNESFHGASKLQPATAVTKSFVGAGALQPQQTTQTGSSQPAQPATTQTSTPVNGDQK